jgi:hypothetical protein
MSTLITAIQSSVGGSGQCSKARKWNKVQYILKRKK